MSLHPLMVTWMYITAYTRDEDGTRWHCIYTYEREIEETDVKVQNPDYFYFVLTVPLSTLRLCPLSYLHNNDANICGWATKILKTEREREKKHAMPRRVIAGIRCTTLYLYYV